MVLLPEFAQTLVLRRAAACHEGKFEQARYRRQQSVTHFTTFPPAEDYSLIGHGFAKLGHSFLGNARGFGDLANALGNKCHPESHLDPPDLRTRLQAEVDATADGYDAAVLAYGLCGGATAGLRAGRIPLVVPRAHDCVTLFLGSRDRYSAEFEAHPGTYWYVQDQLERDDAASGINASGAPGAASGLAAGAILGAGAASDEELQATYLAYVERYGRDDADYLMAELGAWRSHYERAAFVDLGLGGSDALETRAREQAEHRGWRFERLAGELSLVRRLLEGDWDTDFLVLQPGQRLAMSYDDGVIRAE